MHVSTAIRVVNIPGGRACSVPDCDQKACIALTVGELPPLELCFACRVEIVDALEDPDSEWAWS